MTVTDSQNPQAEPISMCSSCKHPAAYHATFSKYNSDRENLERERNGCLYGDCECHVSYRIAKRDGYQVPVTCLPDKPKAPEPAPYAWDPADWQCPF